MNYLKKYTALEAKFNKIHKAPPMSLELEEFYELATELMHYKKLSRSELLDIRAMFETTVSRFGIPYSMYGAEPAYNGADIFRNSPRDGFPERDSEGRWCSDPDMIEHGEPVVISWKQEEDRQWALEQEYIGAYRELYNEQA